MLIFPDVLHSTRFSPLPYAALNIATVSGVAVWVLLYFILQRVINVQ